MIIPLELGPVQAAAIARMQDPATMQCYNQLSDDQGCHCALGILGDEGVKAGLLYSRPYMRADGEMAGIEYDVEPIPPEDAASTYSRYALCGPALRVLGIHSDGHHRFVDRNDIKRRSLPEIAAEVRAAPHDFFFKAV